MITTITLSRARLASYFLFLVSGLGVSSWAPMVPYAKARLDLDEASLGLILLSFGVGALLAMPFTGWLVHRYGSRIVSIIAAPLMIVCIPFLATAESPLSLGMFLFAFGALGGVLNVSMNSHAVTVERLYERPLLSGFHCFFSTGGLLGALIITVLLECGMDLHTAAVTLSCLMGLIVLTQGHRLLPSDTETRSSSPSFSMPSGTVILFGLGCFIFFLAEGAMLDWSAVFLRSQRGYDVAIAGIGYAIFSVAMSLGRLSGDRLIQRFGTAKVMQVSTVIASIGIILAVTMNWNHLEMAGFFLVGLGAANVVPILFSAAGRSPGTSASTALTVATTLGYTGLLLGPAIIGFVAQATNLSLALAILSIPMLSVGLNSRLVDDTSPAIA